MYSIKDITERIQSLYSKGVKSDDSRLSSRHIYSVANSLRNRLHINKANKRQSLSEIAYGVIPFIKMIPVSSVDCSAFSSLGCTIYRSEVKIPRVLHYMNGPVIQWVSPLNKETVIDRIDRNQRYSSFAKYTAKRKRYILENGYIYVNSPQSPKALTMKAVFTDPVEYHSFVLNYCNSGNCEPIQRKDFYLDPSETDTLIKMSSQELIQMFSQIREDQTNNNADSVKQNSK